MKPIKLYLHEEILLLALKDEQGTVAFGTWYTQALGGALLAELLLSGRIEIESVGKKQFARLVNDKAFGNDVLDECLEKVASAKRRATLQTWVSRFSGLRQLKNRVALSLCEKRVLRADAKRVLLVFTQKVFPEINPKPEREIIDRLKKAIFTNSREVEPRTVVLASLANATQLLPVVFEKKKLKERKARLEKLANGEAVSQATQQAVAAVQAAIMVATIMPAITVATIHH